MASREAEKRARRAEREAREAEATLAERRARRLRMLGIAGGVVLVAVVVAIVVSSSGGGPKGGRQSGAADQAAEVQQLFAGVPQKGFSVGKDNAPVTLVEFGDLQCPFCKDAALGSLPTLINDYVKQGKLRIEFRNFAILGDDSVKAGRAAAGAAAQGHAWEFVDLWYRNQGQENSGYVTDAFIKRIASGVRGLDANKVVAAANDPNNTDSLRTATTEASKFGVVSTPTFLIGKTGGTRTQLNLSNPSNPSEYKQAIDPLLR
jgi:protein-disulfide isomerase